VAKVISSESFSSVSDVLVTCETLWPSEDAACCSVFMEYLLHSISFRSELWRPHGLSLMPCRCGSGKAASAAC
jgi:hypothetical protein